MVPRLPRTNLRYSRRVSHVELCNSSVVDKDICTGTNTQHDHAEMLRLPKIEPEVNLQRMSGHMSIDVSRNDSPGQTRQQLQDAFSLHVVDSVSDDNNF